MVKRPIVIACIGYIVGIIYGLYFIKQSIALFFVIVNLYLLLNWFVNKNIKRYLKIFIPKKAIIIFFIAFIIACVHINLLNKKYDKMYNISEVITVNGVVTKVEKQEYSNKYILNVKSINGKKYRNIKLLMYVKKNENVLKFGDYIELIAEYTKPDDSRNFKGFSYSNYLKQSGIYGVIKPIEKIDVVKGGQCNFINTLVNDVRNSIIKKVNNNISNEAKNVFLGILLGEKDQISNEINIYFKESNMSHILAVSGAHVSYIILTITILLNKAGKKINVLCTIVVLIFFMILANFTPSVVRASIMAIAALTSKLIYTKSDIYNNLAISCLLILLTNPYSILNVGFQLSFLGTLGIIVLNKRISELVEKKILKKDHKQSNLHAIRNKLKKFILNVIVVSVSVQLLIDPIMLINFNTLSLNFLISGIVATPIFAGIMIVGILSLLTGSLGIYLFPILEILVNLLIIISKFISNIPFFKLMLKTPNIFWIISYYIVFIVMILLKGKYATRLIKEKDLINKLIKKIVVILLIFCLVIQGFQDFRVKELEIHFIDVNQGDSSLIITPLNKTILIDGGGSADTNYDIGKSVLVPYLLDRRINIIDYMLVSHFDNDHCGGLFTVMEELKVKNIVIGKQFEASENYQRFLKISKEKNIKVSVVEAGAKINIEKDLYFNVLWPDNNNVITENVLNNNSMVCKLHYKSFSMLFTGDIEKTAEEAICKRYENANILKVSILKVAHHGSKTSSTEEFIKLVNPKITLIGVGKDNNFGHPNIQVLDRIQDIGAQIYRTDKMGEITIVTNGKKIRIEK